MRLTLSTLIALGGLVLSGAAAAQSIDCQQLVHDAAYLQGMVDGTEMTMKEIADKQAISNVLVTLRDAAAKAKAAAAGCKSFGK